MQCNHTHERNLDIYELKTSPIHKFQTPAFGVWLFVVWLFSVWLQTHTSPSEKFIARKSENSNQTGYPACYAYFHEQNPKWSHVPPGTLFPNMSQYSLPSQTYTHRTPNFNLNVPKLLTTSTFIITVHHGPPPMPALHLAGDQLPAWLHLIHSIFFVTCFCFFKPLSLWGFCCCTSLHFLPQLK